MKQAVLASLRAAIVALLAFTVLTGVAYPAVVLGIGQVVFPHRANGSLIEDRGRIVGSELIGQELTDPAYVWSRRSHLGVASRAPYDATTSAGANYGFSDGKGRPNPGLLDPAMARVAQLRAADPTNQAPIPSDLVTASASGLDPHISPEAAYFQLPRVARHRRASEAEVRAVIDAHVESRTLGILGEPRINVVLLNRALDARFGQRR